MTGVDELAQAVAWWLNHPYRALALYLLFIVAGGIVRGIAGAALLNIRDRWE